MSDTNFRNIASGVGLNSLRRTAGEPAVVGLKNLASGVGLNSFRRSVGFSDSNLRNQASGVGLGSLRHDADFRNGVLESLPLRIDVPRNVVIEVPIFIPSLPFLDIECGQTIEADIIASSITSFARTNDPIANQSFFARQVRFRSDIPQHVKITCFGFTFNSYIRLIRNLANKDWTGAQNGDQAALIQLDVTDEISGPFTIEVSTVNPFTTGHFKLTVECGTPPPPILLIPGVSLYPGTTGYEFGTVWGVNVAGTSSINDNLVKSDMVITAMLQFFIHDYPNTGDIYLVAAPAMPWDWSSVNVPTGISLVVPDPTSRYAYFRGTPTTTTRTMFATQVFIQKTGTLFEESMPNPDWPGYDAAYFTIMVDKPVGVSSKSWFEARFAPSGTLTPLLWSSGGGVVDVDNITSIMLGGGGVPEGIAFEVNGDGNLLRGYVYSASPDGAPCDIFGDVRATLNFTVHGQEQTGPKFIDFEGGYRWTKTDPGTLGTYTLTNFPVDDSGNPFLNPPATITLFYL